MAARLTLRQAQSNLMTVTMEVHQRERRGAPMDQTLVARLMAAQADLNIILSQQMNQNRQLARTVRRQNRIVNHQANQIEGARGRALARVEAVRARYRQDVGEGAGAGAVIGAVGGVGLYAAAVAITGGAAAVAAAPLLAAGGIGGVGGAGVGGYEGHRRNRNNFNYAVAAARDLENNPSPITTDSDSESSPATSDSAESTTTESDSD